MLKATNTNQFALPGTSERFIHIVTFEKQSGFNSTRTFIYFCDLETSKRYCEEIFGGQLLQIKDEDLLKDIENWLFLHKFSQVVILPRDYLTHEPIDSIKKYF